MPEYRRPTSGNEGIGKGIKPPSFRAREAPPEPQQPGAILQDDMWQMAGNRASPVGAVLRISAQKFKGPVFQEKPPRSRQASRRGKIVEAKWGERTAPASRGRPTCLWSLGFQVTAKTPSSSRPAARKRSNSGARGATQIFGAPVVAATSISIVSIGGFGKSLHATWGRPHTTCPYFPIPLRDLRRWRRDSISASAGMALNEGGELFPRIASAHRERVCRSQVVTP